MEEDASITAAPVTRLRRRLSVEQQDDVKSPSAPSTPSKKRGGRLAAKPQLELIDENSSNNTPRGTKKIATKDVSEVNEERPITPARRSARIRSNTSIVSDTTLNVDSPRAKRAARRTSQIGSDNEAPSTPLKQTRRTRKDSSIVDKQDTPPATKTIEEPAAKEIESNSQSYKDVDKTETTQNQSARKSPRLTNKRNSSKFVNDTIEITEENKTIPSETEISTDPKEPNGPISTFNVSKHDNELNSTTDKTQRNNLSISSHNLIENLNTKPMGHSSNKSTSSIEGVNNLKKKKRHRTKSLTTTSQNFENDSIFYSDNEKARKKNAKNINSVEIIKSSIRNNDNLLNTSVQNENNHSKQLGSEIEENKNSLVENSDKTPLILNSSHKEENSEKNIQHDNFNTTSKILAKPLINEVTSVIYFDDSDTNGSGKNNKQFDIEDQCVPVVANHFVIEKSSDNMQGTLTNQKDISFSNKTNEKASFNNSCEPMDIDETIPTNVSVTNISHNKTADEKLNYSPEHRLSSPQMNINTDKNRNRSKQEVSSLALSQIVDKGENENKSTLILSQLKDVSTTENSLSKSPKSTNTEILSKSVNNDTAKEKGTDKKNLSLDYMTSTPLQQKNLKKMAMHINTSVINNSKIETQNDDIGKNKSQSSKTKNISEDSSEGFESENESSKEISNMIDDEAEEASDDYESGDSQDEDEKQYAKENEVVEKGETLTSNDDEDSDDTDYEKDSFVVSSDEEDNELLTGSGDDLSMSDNELTMSKKSKKKYDERKKKEQTKASREMFEARHGKSNNSSTSELTKAKRKNRRRLDSSTLKSDEEIMTGSKKSKKIRLESSQEGSIIESDSHDTKKTNENKRLSQSICNDSRISEHEITTNCNITLEKEDPLLTQVKPEPQSPLKEFNMSCVPIMDKIEEIQVNTNISMMETNEKDPLQEASEESNASSISENVEITNNYEALLKELTKEKDNRKNKSLDLSLNLKDQNKQTQKEPIIEQLNITQTKTSKKNKVSQAKTLDNNNVKRQSKNDDTDSSSDSIHLQLLFSDDSVDSVKKEQQSKQENFIPLKRTEGKSNIAADDQIDSNLDQTADTTLTSSTKKKKKNSISVVQGFERDDRDENKDNVTKAIETKDDTNDPETSLNTSTKRKKKKKSVLADNSELIDAAEGNDCVSIFIDTKGDRSDHEEISQNTSTKKKKKKNSICIDDVSDRANDIAKTEGIDSVTMFIDTKGNRSDTDKSLNTSTKKKKKNKSISENVNAEGDDSSVALFIDTKGNRSDTNMSLNNSSKKKKKKSISVNDGTDQNNDKVTNEKDENVAMFIDTKDNKNEMDTSLNVSAKKKKKKNSISANDTTVQPNDNDGVFMFINTEGEQSNPVDPHTSLSSSKKKKNKKKRASDNESGTVTGTSHNEIKVDQVNDSNLETNIIEPESVAKASEPKPNEVRNSKKRKRQLSVALNSEEDHLQTVNISIPMNESVSFGNQKKKQKLTQSENIFRENQDSAINKYSKKRKQRGDEEGIEKSAKLFKQSSPDKVNVPRLPSAILNQLDDKPSKELLAAKKSKVVSTTQFVVEDTRKRKNKPSNYLEESVYLNDSHDQKKQKGLIKIPKVLPFVPTASTSDSGFTTKFVINIIPKETKFIAQTSNMTGFKNEYLRSRKIKRMGTYEMYKTQRNTKLSKF